MMYTSLEFSKLLKENGCDLESKMYWNEYHKMSEGDETFSALITKKMHDEMMYNDNDIYAYDLLWDICRTNAKEFFGEIPVCIACGNGSFENDGTQEEPLDDYCNDCGDDNPNNYTEPVYKWHTKEILEMLQQDKPQKIIEKYILEHCLFNPKNKEAK